MTQQSRLYLSKLLLLILLFESIICSPIEQYNTRQDRSPFFDINPYFNVHYGDAKNRRNFDNQQYQPQQTHFPTPQLNPFLHHTHRDDAFLQSRTGVPDTSDYSISQRSEPISELQPLPLPLPYQGKSKKSGEETNLDDKIRSIFYVGPEKHLNLFNTTLDPNLSSLNRMLVDESLDSNKENTTNLSSSQSSSPPSSSLSSSPTGPASASASSMSKSTSSSTMNNEEPTFKVQRTPDGKLGLVFNDILSLQRPTAPQIQRPTTVHKRPDIVFPSTPVSETAFNGCNDYDGQSLCTNVKDYPNLARLNIILQREFSEMGVFFTEDVEHVVPHNVSQRFGGDPDEIEPCRSVERTIYPQAGETLDSRWLLIVNDKNSYKQGVRIEECIGKELPCNTIDEFLPNNYRSFCKQSYVYRSLVALTENGTVIKEQFKIPSCCKCVLRIVKRS